MKPEMKPMWVTPYRAPTSVGRERRRHQEGEARSPARRPRRALSLEGEQHHEQDDPEAEGDSDRDLVADRVRGRAGEEDPAQAEEAEPGEHAGPRGGGDAVVGDHGHQMGGDEVVRAAADEHDEVNSHRERVRMASERVRSRRPATTAGCDAGGARRRGPSLRARVVALVARSRPVGSSPNLSGSPRMTPKARAD